MTSNAGRSLSRYRWERRRFLSEARSVAALEHGNPWSGDVTAAISWYKKLLVAPDRTENAAVVRTLSEEGGPPLVARACADGFLPACDTGRPLAAPRGRRTRQQP